MQMGTRNRGVNSVLLPSMFLFFHLFPSQYSSASINVITSQQPLSQGQTLTSSGQKFELGFFRPNNSTQYMGIWYKNLYPRKVVWVANREKPISATDRSVSISIGSDGNLSLLDGNQNTTWATQVTAPLNNSVYAELLDNGNLVLKDITVLGRVTLWESFNYPSDTFLANMSIGMNIKTGEKRFLTSWKSEDDPSPGNFVLRVLPQRPPQAIVWMNETTPYWRSGQWDRSKFIGIPEMEASYQSGNDIQQDIDEGTAYLTKAYPTNSSLIIYTVLAPDGLMKVIYWDEGKAGWSTLWETPKHPCEIYGACGPFGVCKQSGSPICTCLKGFVPKSRDEWSKENWTDGCVRQTELLCKNNTHKSEKEDQFLKMGRMKLPDLSEYINLADAQKCQNWCINNCSCVAYAFVSGIGCMIWSTDLMDVEEFSYAGEDLFLRLAHSELREKQTPILIISLIVVSGVIILGTTVYCRFRWQYNKRGKPKKIENDLADARDPAKENLWRNHGDSTDLPMFNFDTILVATNDFSITNKLGQGGFGPVYKGKLQDGKEIAVKRLSNSSGQGGEEFKNETILISKLQHRNLVRLLGCCIEGEEKLLIYEYMSNKSLDTFLFDRTKRMKLDWAKRFNIIQGIARGLLYLHRDSCLKVIHRDLKVSNILLDEYMNPKISDFGMARTFQETQDIANTLRVAGTFGYMAPEYTMRGIFSEKSDVFSFGVLLLEIISGRKNTSFDFYDQHLNLLGYAWQLWNQSRILDFLDDTLVDDSYSPLEVTRCIHVGLLCVQGYAEDRPITSAVVSMLNSETDRPQPKQPPFTCQTSFSGLRPLHNNTCSLNEVTQSTIEGR